jgi:hypothetical protein
MSKQYCGITVTCCQRASFRAEFDDKYYVSEFSGLGNTEAKAIAALAMALKDAYVSDCERARNRVDNSQYGIMGSC